MIKNFKLFNNYLVIEVETLYDLEIFCLTRKLIDQEIINFWRDFARGEKIEFGLTMVEFKKFYLNGK